MKNQFDYLVIGSGIAGLTFALKAARSGSVAIVTKKDRLETSTNYAQGGIASVFGLDDTFDLHIQDTLNAGVGLCHREIVELVVRTGPERIRDLLDLGVAFNRAQEPTLFDLGREGGHSRNRILHAQDMTGAAVEKVLMAAAESEPNIVIFEHHLVLDLIIQHHSMKTGSLNLHQQDICRGAYVLDTSADQIHTFVANAVLLCTGGAGKVYLYTSNPDIASGDGAAMAYRAGASIANMEFIQFHPTCLYHPKAKSFLISEAVRGEGAILRGKDGEPFMKRYHPMADLAPRDVVGRAIDAEMKKTGAEYALLDITHKDADFIRKRFPNICAKCLELGYDMTREPLPVVPAAHYQCGGVVTNADGETEIDGLFAAGEVACTGLHGANRLASNSLLEALVVAHRAADVAVKQRSTLHAPASAKATAGKPRSTLPPWESGNAADPDELVVVTHNWDEIRRLMWDYVGIVRTDKRLLRARARIQNLQREINQFYWDYKVTPDLIELRNLALVAELIIESALLRKESRGLHYTLDYPNRNDEHWRHDTVLRKSGG